MRIDELIKDKSVKPKEKTEIICSWILDASLPVDELIAFAEQQKDSAKATCIEALEYATNKNPYIANEAVFAFVTSSLTEKAPRIKWESAKVIHNTAHLFPNGLNKAILNLLANTKHDGTVVRWSSAVALSKILSIQQSQRLLSDMENICASEEKNSIIKIYSEAIKKNKK